MKHINGVKIKLRLLIFCSKFKDYNSLFLEFITKIYLNVICGWFLLYNLKTFGY